MCVCVCVWVCVCACGKLKTSSGHAFSLLAVDKALNPGAQLRTGGAGFAAHTDGGEESRKRNTNCLQQRIIVKKRCMQECCICTIIVGSDEATKKRAYNLKQAGRKLMLVSADTRNHGQRWRNRICTLKSRPSW